jgi:DNA-binding XRE family transcriptional regulator
VFRCGVGAEIDRPAVVRIEVDRQFPTIETLIRLAAVIGVPLRDLVG